MKKFRDYAFLSSFLFAILMGIVSVLSVFEIYISSAEVSAVIASVLGALVFLGIISKPSSEEEGNNKQENKEEENKQDNN